MRLHQKKWTARYFDLNQSYGDPKRFTEKPVNQTMLHQLWLSLNEQNILTLPSQSSLRKKLMKYEIDTATLYVSNKITTTTDGVLYCFELRNLTKSRSYTYGNPNSYLKEYPNVEELMNAVMIILLTQKYLGQPLRP